MRTQADLVDQLFNSSEKRLARILLLMAGFGESGEADTLIPKISQETLAEMIGTTRSRVSFFMNRFRKLGFIDYSDRIRVHKSLLNVVLHDHLPNGKTRKTRISEVPRKKRELRSVTILHTSRVDNSKDANLNNAISRNRHGSSMAVVASRSKRAS
jgi:hypothetical protein